MEILWDRGTYYETSSCVNIKENIVTVLNTKVTINMSFVEKQNAGNRYLLLRTHIAQNTNIGGFSGLVENFLQ